MVRWMENTAGGFGDAWNEIFERIINDGTAVTETSGSVPEPERAGEGTGTAGTSAGPAETPSGGAGPEGTPAGSSGGREVRETDGAAAEAPEAEETAAKASGGREVRETDGAAAEAPEAEETAAKVSGDREVRETDGAAAEAPEAEKTAAKVSGGREVRETDGAAAETPEAEAAEGEEGERTGEVVLSDDGQTAVIAETEPETAYLAATPAEGAASPGSRPRSSVASVVSRTAQSAAETAVPAVKSFAFSLLNALIVFFIGMQVARVLRKMFRNALDRMHMDESLKSFLSSIVYVLVCGISAFIALEKLGVSSASVVALLGSAGLAISLSLQDFLGNFAGGLIIMVLKPFHSGDYIVCDSREGTVASTGLFYTTLNTVDNRRVIMPNSKLTSSEITNVTAEADRRLEIKITISYGSDLRLAKDILRRLFDEYPDIYHDREILLAVSELAEDGVELTGRAWLAQENYWDAKWTITEQLKLAYDEAGIEIPFRQMDVHLAGRAETSGGR